MLKRVVTGDTELKETSEIQEASSQKIGDNLMHSVLDNDKDTIENGKMLKDSINMGIGSFTPELMYEQLVKNYAMAEKILGPSLIRRLTEYDPNYVKRNINIPEFQRKLEQNIKNSVNNLKKSSLLDESGSLTKEGLALASLILYREELDRLVDKGILGEKTHKKEFRYGDRQEIEDYKKGYSYKDIAVKASVHKAVRRGHLKLIKEDLKMYKRASKGNACIIYCLDASGSMKGSKIDMCKKAGIALAYKALNDKDIVGLLVFGTDIKEHVKPTDNFLMLIKAIANIKAARETNIAKSVEKALELFPKKEMTKHLIIISDALPTVGQKPEEETLQKIGMAANIGITVSVVGIELDKKGTLFAKKIVELGNGNLYNTRTLENLDAIVLDDYNSIR
jgi:Mg-chelatase subunit ChlD